MIMDMPSFNNKMHHSILDIFDLIRLAKQTKIGCRVTTAKPKQVVLVFNYKPQILK
jgi:hypothetical protein